MYFGFLFGVVLNQTAQQRLFTVKVLKAFLFSWPIFFFWIQSNVPFKIISLIETSQSIGGAKREYPGKTT